MMVQKVYLPQHPKALGESHPVPAQALPTYENCKKAEPLRCLSLRTKDGRLHNVILMQEVHVTSPRPIPACNQGCYSRPSMVQPCTWCIFKSSNTLFSCVLYNVCMKQQIIHFKLTPSSSSLRIFRFLCSALCLFLICLSSFL